MKSLKSLKNNNVEFEHFWFYWLKAVNVTAPFKSFCEEFTNELQRRHHEQSHRLSAQKSELKQTTKDLTQLLNALKGGASANIIIEEMQRLETRQKELTEIITKADHPIPLVHLRMADLYHERLDTIYNSLRDPETNQQAMEIVRSLIDHIDLVPTKGALKACIHGDIAGLFAFMNQQKSPNECPDQSVWFEAVAGAGVKLKLYSECLPQL